MKEFEPHRRHCVVSLSKNINPSLVLVQPRKIRPFITERLLMGRKESNQKHNERIDESKWSKTGLSPPVKYFTDRSKALLLLWIFYGVFLSSVCYAFMRVCLFVPCGHLLGKG